MARVSILIPAYRPDYFDLCIASALAQTMQDFELIVSDDCPTDDIERVLSKWKDPRIRYVRNATRGEYGSNRDNLLRLATGEYVKFLYDDDYLYPRSIEALLAAIEATGARMAFHHRHFVDPTGRVIGSPAPLASGRIGLISPEIVYSLSIGRAVNFIGEPTTVLFETRAFRDLEMPYGARGRMLRFIDDVCLHYKFARAGHVIAGVPEFLSAFRMHPQQNSSSTSPLFSAGLFEWEFLMRDARQEGLLDPDAYAAGIAIVHKLFRAHEQAFPELGNFLALAGEPRGGSFVGGAFGEALDLAYLSLELRRTAMFPATEKRGMQ